jgi:hypothetical protein
MIINSSMTRLAQTVGLGMGGTETPEVFVEITSRLKKTQCR